MNKGANDLITSIIYGFVGRLKIVLLGTIFGFLLSLIYFNVVFETTFSATGSFVIDRAINSQMSATSKDLVYSTNVIDKTNSVLEERNITGINTEGDLKKTISVRAEPLSSYIFVTYTSTQSENITIILNSLLDNIVEEGNAHYDIFGQSLKIGDYSVQYVSNMYPTYIYVCISTLASAVVSIGIVYLSFIFDKKYRLFLDNSRDIFGSFFITQSSDGKHSKGITNTIESVINDKKVSTIGIISLERDSSLKILIRELAKEYITSKLKVFVFDFNDTFQDSITNNDSINQNGEYPFLINGFLRLSKVEDGNLFYVGFREEGVFSRSLKVHSFGKLLESKELEESIKIVVFRDFLADDSYISNVKSCDLLIIKVVEGVSLKTNLDELIHNLKLVNYNDYIFTVETRPKTSFKNRPSKARIRY